MPFAEAVFREIIQRNNLMHEFTIDSAGTSNWHEGERPHKETVQKLQQKGYRNDRYV